MNLRSLDLNLLPVLEAIHTERSLTRQTTSCGATQDYALRATHAPRIAAPCQSIVTLAFFTTCAMRATSDRKNAAAGSGGVSLIS